MRFITLKYDIRHVHWSYKSVIIIWDRPVCLCDWWFFIINCKDLAS